MFKKYKSFTSFEKEEAWLNEMASNGWIFIKRSVWGTYCFEQGKLEVPNFRIDYRTFNKTTDFNEYIQLFIDAGWHHVYGTKHSGYQYFIPQHPNVDEDIFSDDASKAGRYRRLSTIWLSLFLAYTAIFLSLLSSGSIDLNAMLHPKELYFTPGLWEMTGSDFWRAFIFETPFALGRGFSWLLYVVILGCYLYLTLRAVIESRKHKF